MANRKVLINRHTSGSSAPEAVSMYLGEIAVAHETGKETLFTKNNAGDMIPFISCAQTISIIDSKVQASEDVVKAKANEAHLEVESGGTTGATEWILSTKDIQSENEFKAYSAETKTRIDKNVSAITDTLGIISALTNVVVTDISGDTIIVAEKVENGTDSNSYNLTHKQAPAAIATGFNKLATDAYGHVTASTAVEAADIEGLGFKNSAWTEEKITEAIEGLDSNSATTDNRHYVTAITIENGRITSFGEAADPQLSVESAGTGNVVSKIEVADHKITYQTVSVATSEDIQALSASVINLSAVTGEFSGATDTKFSELSAYTKDVDDKVKALSAGTIQLSADTVAYVNQLSGYAHSEIVELSGATVSAFTAIQAMDKAADAENGKVVTTVSEVDGVVSETKANVKDLQLGGYVKDTTATGDIASADTINAALSKLENKANAITIANADKSINVTTGATGTDINVNIKTSDPILAKDGGNGVYSTLNLVKIETGLPTTVKERYELQGINGAKIGQDIDIPKDSHIVSITYITDTADTHYQNLEYKYLDADGNEQTAYVDMSSLVLEAEFKSGVTSTDGIVHGVVDSTSEKDSNNDSFLTVGADGFKVDGIKDEINAKIAALDVTDTAAAGQYVSAVNEVDGKVSMTRANVSEAILNNYTKGTDATAVAATDSVNEAISKLENQVDKAKAAATTKVVEGTDAGNNMTIVPTTGDDSSVTYTVNLTDVASKAALDAEIAARKAVDGQNGDTYAANAGTNFISDATSLNDADVKLDTAIKTLSGNAHDAMIARDNVVFSSANTYTDEQIDEVYASGVSYTDDKVAAEIALLDSVGSASTTGHYLTSVTITDGKISAVGEVAVPAAVAITATTAAPSDAASAVLTGITADGKDNHNLTFGMSNKVFSASTADEAVKVKNALSISGYASSESTALDNAVNYDGSAAQSITFGKDTAAGKSMSFNGGVVDVEIIDCGEY